MFKPGSNTPPLDFDDKKSSLRLDEQVDLAATQPFRRRLDVWERREDQRSVNSEKREQVIHMVEDAKPPPSSLFASFFHRPRGLA